MITHYNFSKITPLTDIYKVVARTGFEPIQRESKSLVLPLHHRAIKIGAGSGNRTRMACLEGRNFTIKLYPRAGRKSGTGLLAGQFKRIFPRVFELDSTGGRAGGLFEA